MIELRTALILLFLLLMCQAVDPTTTSSTTETTTSGSVFIRRKSSRMGGGIGGGRLSLINTRFKKRPKKKNLDRDQLLEILGTSYDPAWMSIDEPLPLVNKDPERGATYVSREDGWPHTELVKQLKMSNISMELLHMRGLSSPDVPGLVKTVENWLLKRASCPVRYAWEDIGALFWPRYIRRGECTSVAGTCSWPPGMHCVPSGTTTLHVLRWQCKVPKGKGRRRNFKNSRELKNRDYQNGDQPINLKCSWIRVPYPITNDCLCTC